MNSEFGERTGNRSSGIAVLNILLGIWLFVSPWIYGASANTNSWNAWLVGAAIVIFAMIRVANPNAAGFLGSVNIALGIWVFVSSWILGYTGNTGRFINSLCVGVLVFLVAMSAWNARSRAFIPHHR